MAFPGYVPTLLELALVKQTSTRLWSQNNLKEYTRKDLNGHVHIEKALPVIKKSIHALKLPVRIESLLNDVSERVGHEIRFFMIQSVLNSSDLKCNNSLVHFSNYGDADLNLSKDLQWTSGGEISVEKTLISFMVNHPQTSPVLHFLSACETGNESLISKIWNSLTRDQKLAIEVNLSWTESDVFPAYWIYFFQNQLDVYFKIYESKDFVINSKGSMHCYMVTNSMKTCFRSRTQYFYSKLDQVEKEKFVKVIDINGIRPILLGPIKYSFKFFESPILNHDVNKLVLDHLSEDEFEYLIDYLLSEINDSCELHGNVLIYVMSLAREDLKSWTLKDPDFYFSLISKGQFRIVQMLLNNENKNSLKKEIMADLESAKVSSSLDLARDCKYSDDLNEFIGMIAEKDESFSEKFRSIAFCHD